MITSERISHHDHVFLIAEPMATPASIIEESLGITTKDIYEITNFIKESVNKRGDEEGKNFGYSRN